MLYFYNIIAYVTVSKQIYDNEIIIYVHRLQLNHINTKIVWKM